MTSLFQVKSQRTKLLSHPLVACLLRNKWKACGRYVYYSKLVVYMFYLIFLTGYSLYTVKDQYRMKCADSNVTVCHCVATKVPDTAASHLWIDFGKWIIVIISCFSLLLEVSCSFLLDFCDFECLSQNKLAWLDNSYSRQR